MSEQAEIKKISQIVIRTESGEKIFEEPEELRGWIQQQKMLYSKLISDSNRYGLQPLFQGFEKHWQTLLGQIESDLLRSKNDAARFNSKASQLTGMINDHIVNKRLFTSDHESCEFFKRQQAIKPEYGIAAIAIEFDTNITNIDSAMLEGINQAKAYLSGSEEQQNDQNDSMQKLRDKWDAQLAEHRNKVVSEFETKLNEFELKNDQIAEIVQKWTGQTEEQTKKVEEYKDKYKELFEESLQDSRKKLENLTDTYDNKLALQAAVRYWEIQRKSHSNKSIAYAIILAIASGSVICILNYMANHLLDFKLSEIHVSKLVVIATLTTFGIWFIKIIANIFMSHMHLATDAQERRTMIHTYLALIRKGQGPKEEDRQLILQTLFRPSVTDLVKSDKGPAQLVDFINRMAPKPS